MATEAQSDREGIRGAAADSEWGRADDNGIDVFTRGIFEVRVRYDAIDRARSAKHLRAQRQIGNVPPGLVKATVLRWLTSTKPDQV